MGSVEQSDHARQGRVQHSHGSHRIDSFGQRIEQRLVNGQQLGERSLAAIVALVVAPDAVSRLEERDAVTHFDHRTGHVPADDERQRQIDLVCAATDVGVDRIDRHRRHLHEHLPLGRHRRRQFAVADILRGTG